MTEAGHNAPPCLTSSLSFLFFLLTSFHTSTTSLLWSMPSKIGSSDGSQLLPFGIIISISLSFSSAPRQYYQYLILYLNVLLYLNAVKSCFGVLAQNLSKPKAIFSKPASVVLKKGGKVKLQKNATCFGLKIAAKSRFFKNLFAASCKSNCTFLLPVLM